MFSSLDKDEDILLRIAKVILGLQKVCLNMLEELAMMIPHLEEIKLGNGDKSNLGYIECWIKPCLKSFCFFS